jgi:hypothetical protein
MQLKMKNLLTRGSSRVAAPERRKEKNKKGKGKEKRGNRTEYG